MSKEIKEGGKERKNKDLSDNQSEQIKDIRDIRDEMDKNLQAARINIEETQSEPIPLINESISSGTHYSTQIAEQKKILTSLEDAIQTTQDQLNKLNMKISGLEGLYTQKAVNLTEISNQLLKVIQDRQMSEEIENKLKNNLENLEKQIYLQEINHREFLEKINISTIEINQLNAKMELLIREISDKRNFNEALERELLENKDKIKSNKNEIDEKEESLIKLKDDIIQKENVLKELDNKVITRDHTMSDLDKSYAQLNQGILQKQNSQKLKEIKTEISTKEDSITKLTEGIDDREKYIEQLEIKIIDRTKNFATENENREDLRGEIHNSELRLQELNVNLNNADTNFDQKSKQLIEITGKLEVDNVISLKLLEKTQGNESLLKQQNDRLREYDEKYTKNQDESEKSDTQYQLIHDKIKDATEELERIDSKKRQTDKLLKDAEINFNNLDKKLGILEKSIRESEGRLKQTMVLNLIRKISKIYGGVIFGFGLLLFIAGLIMFAWTPPFNVENFTMLTRFLLMFMGILIFISALFHMNK